MSRQPTSVADIPDDASLVSAAVTFRDRAYRSRTFVFVDGSTAPVVNSRIAVTLAQQIAEIERHTDFDRIDDPAGDAR
ncbi:hypothetical protein bAD24_I16750 [Burkholderia sp. AD24]|nr:hypothetical protein bAD24_I16750 [Burkholderia sp. AD24]